MFLFTCSVLLDAQSFTKLNTGEELKSMLPEAGGRGGDAELHPASAGDPTRVGWRFGPRPASVVDESLFGDVSSSCDRRLSLFLHIITFSDVVLTTGSTVGARFTHTATGRGMSPGQAQACLHVGAASRCVVGFF